MHRARSKVRVREKMIANIHTAIDKVDDGDKDVGKVDSDRCTNHKFTTSCFFAYERKNKSRGKAQSGMGEKCCANHRRKRVLRGGGDELNNQSQSHQRT
jgi:hypothetical protein